MKVLFAGLGSIGTRHLQNMHAILNKQGTKATFYALRATDRPLRTEIAPLIQQSYFSAEEVPDDFDIVFITNPTSEHSRTLRKLKNKTKHLFIEKPIVLDSHDDILEMLYTFQGVAYVACPLRHTRVFEALKRICAEQKDIFSVRAICSSNLSAWRPRQDYRNTYSAISSLGGGVERDLIHEWDYLTDLFGFPCRMQYFSGHYSYLEMDCSDVACYIAQYIDKVVELHIDYFGSKLRREVELYTKDDVIVGDFANQEIRYLKTGEVMPLKEERNDWCTRELEYFLGLIEHNIGPNINTPTNAMQVLKLALGG